LILGYYPSGHKLSRESGAKPAS